MTVQMYKTKIKKIKQTVKHMAKNDNEWTRSLSRINLKIIFLQNYQFFMNYAKGPVKIHWLEAEKITFDPWRNFRIASLQAKPIEQRSSKSKTKLDVMRKVKYLLMIKEEDFAS